MKISIPRKETNNSSLSGKKALAPLPLVPEQEEEAIERKTSKFKLRTDPANDDSPTHGFTVKHLTGVESVREAISFYKEVLKVCRGHNIPAAQGENRRKIIAELLEGQALSAFNNATDEALVNAQANAGANARIQGMANNDTDAVILAAVATATQGVTLNSDHVAMGVRAVITYMAPHKALAKQKRYMRRQCRKPATMSIREFANHLQRVNHEEMPYIPPFAPGQSLPEDELIDIVLNGIPKSWTREMDKQDFDPMEKTFRQVIDFCQRMEASEDFEPSATTKTTDNKGSKNSKSNKKPKASGGGSDYECMFHGKNNTHSTEDCLVLKNQVKSLKGDGGKSPSKNKTWKRNADENKTKTRKELAAFVRKQARKELHAFAKKRKESSKKEDSDDESSGSLNAMDNIDLSDFNYAKMDDLKIDSEDELSEGEVAC